MANVKPDPQCAICGNSIKSASCTHPWHLPFSEWGGKARSELLAIVPLTTEEK